MRRFPRLHLESLEARDCPAFTIQYYPSTLVVRGAPTLPSVPLSGDGINFTMLSNNLIQIQEVGNAGATVVNLGRYRPVRNLIVQVPYTNTDINFDLGGFRLVSNVLLNIGKGDLNPLTPNFINFIDGTIGGNLTILGGAGIENINIGEPDPGLPATPRTVLVQGNVTVVGSPRQDTLVGLGDVLNLRAGSAVRGFISAVDIDNLEIGELTGPVSLVSGNVSQNGARSRNVARMNVYGEVRGSIFYQGTNALDPTFRDSLTLHTDNASAPALVHGSVFASYAFGDSQMVIEEDVVVRGSVTYAANGPGSLGSPPLAYINQLILAGTVEGTVQFNGGAGASQVIFPGTGTVFGSFSITAGNGDNDMSTFAGAISGNLFISLGNGENTIVLTQAPGGTFYWYSGNGNNDITLGGLGTTDNSIWKVDIRLGTGDDTLTLDATVPLTSQSLTGRVTNKGSILGDSFIQDATWTLLPTLILTNFPA